MSRMIAYVAAAPLDGPSALGADRLAQFAGLARLHADGWGTAWVEPGGRVRATGSPESAASADLVRRLAEPSTTRLAYLRFASRGAPPAPENVQPFLRHGAAFAHNGLLAPRESALALLTPTEQAALRGITDSEIYFSVLRRALESDPEAGTAHDDVAARLARAVSEVRHRFEHSCLNALLLTPAALYVVHSAGTAPPPHAAFAERGFDRGDLPPGHDASYNTLWTTVTDAGTRIVSTTGIDVDGWSPLPPDTVTAVTAEVLRSVRVADAV